jgi:hypothetical protein
MVFFNRAFGSTRQTNNSRRFKGFIRRSFIKPLKEGNCAASVEFANQEAFEAMHSSQPTVMRELKIVRPFPPLDSLMNHITHWVIPYLIAIEAAVMIHYRIEYTLFPGRERKRSRHPPRSARTGALSSLQRTFQSSIEEHLVTFILRCSTHTG